MSLGTDCPLLKLKPPSSSTVCPQKVRGIYYGPLTLATDSVAEAAVVGINDELTGQAVNAFVSLKDGNEANDQTKKDLVLQVRKSIGPFAAPKAIHVVPDLPKTRSGKIMRRILRKILAGEEDQLGDTSTVSRPLVYMSWRVMMAVTVVTRVLSTGFVGKDANVIGSCRTTQWSIKSLKSCTRPRRSSLMLVVVVLDVTTCSRRRTCSRLQADDVHVGQCSVVLDRRRMRSRPDAGLYSCDKDADADDDVRGICGCGSNLSVLLCSYILPNSKGCRCFHRLWCATAMAQTGGRQCRSGARGA